MFSADAKKIAWIIWLVILIIACKEKSKSDPPVIWIDKSIYESDVFQVLDTIQISATVRDDELVKSVEFHLRDQFYNNIDLISRIDVNQKEMQINVDYIIEDLSLTGGQYTITATAYDEDQTAVDGWPITIWELPLAWEGIQVVQVDGQVSTYGLDGEILGSFTVPFLTSKGAQNNKDGVIYLGNDLTGTIHAYNDVSGNAQWSGNTNGLSAEGYFRDMDYNPDIEKVLASTSQNEIAIFTNQGNQEGSIVLPNSEEIYGILSTEERTYTAVANSSNENHQFRSYYNQSANLEQSHAFFGEIVDMEIMYNDDVFIVSNDEMNSGIVTVYNPQDQTYDQINLFIDVIQDVEIISSSRIMLGTLDGLYRYNMSTGQLVLISNPGFTPTYLDYDVVNNILFAATHDQLRYYHAETWELLNLIPFSSDVTMIFNKYNK